MSLTWSNFRAERKARGRPFVVAHRGARALEPENTLRAFALSLVHGADALETDLWFTRDHELVLFHDATVERTTDGLGAISGLSLAEIKRLRTRTPQGELIDERVPTLIELIQSTQAQTPLLLELKDPRFLERKFAEQLVKILATQGILERCAIISFHADYVAMVKQVEPAIPTGNVTMWNPLPTGGTNAELLGPLWPLIYLNPLYVWWAHRLGKIVAPLDPTPEPRMSYYLRQGVDAVLADNPQSVIESIKNG